MGTYEGDFKAGQVNSIKFANSNARDSFDKYWEPEQSGTYVFRLYLDPENDIAERSEDNNFLEGKVRVV